MSRDQAWDRSPCTNATVADLDLLALRDTLVRMEPHSDEEGVEPYLSDRLALSNFVPPLLVRDPLTGVLRPRNFAMLLFGRNVQRFIRGAFSVVSVYEETGHEAAPRQRIELAGTVLKQLAVLLPLIEGLAFTLHAERSLTKPSVLNPQRALREALVNAFAHRDYQRDEPIHLKAYFDRVEVNSPGSLSGEVSLEAMRRGEAFARWPNRTLAWLFSRLGLAEDEGQGIETIHRTMHGARYPPPEFQADEAKVVCILRAHPRAGA
jgi:ATP-dependent DNA helicase RecG